jgi:hypothetical protein
MGVSAAAEPTGLLAYGFSYSLQLPCGGPGTDRSA